jgi:hypothetical protein
VPLIDLAPDADPSIPPTWTYVVCMQGNCDETWTVDTAEFDPPLTVPQIQELLTPLLLAHETTDHGKW